MVMVAHFLIANTTITLPGLALIFTHSHRQTVSIAAKCVITANDKSAVLIVDY